MKIRNLWRKWTRKSILSAAKSPRKWHVHCVCFENATSRANTNVMLTSYFYVCYRARYWRWRHFLYGPGMHTVKAAKQVYNSTWIALLKHGFVLVKTWLLIACGTGFYAIICIILSILCRKNYNLQSRNVWFGCYVRCWRWNFWRKMTSTHAKWRQNVTIHVLISCTRVVLHP